MTKSKLTTSTRRWGPAVVVLAAVVGAGAIFHREVKDMGKVVREVAQVVGAEALLNASDPDSLQPLSALGLAEPRDGDDLVILGKLPRDAERDLPGRARYQYLAA